MSDTSKGSPGSNPSKGGQDQRRHKGRIGAAASPADETPAPASDEPVTQAPEMKPEEAAPAAAAPVAEGSAPAEPALTPAGALPGRSGGVPPGGTNAPPPRPAAPAQPPRPDRDRWILPVAAGGGVVVLLVAWMIVAHRPGPAIDPARLEALEARVVALAPVTDRVARLESQGQALQRADQRLTVLEQALREREPVGLEALNTLRGRLDRQETALGDERRRADSQLSETERALSQRITGAEAQLAQRVAAAEAALAPKLSALEATVQQRIAAAEQAARQQAEAQQQQMNARFAVLEQREARIVAAEQRLNRLVASTALSTALEAGKPLGTALAGLPGAPPPALARYSSAAPPTIASLRLSFEDAARAARAAAEPGTAGQGVLEAAATRLSNLVTIRRGDTVVWGDAISGELEGARQALNAGDVDAAVRKVEGLPPAVQGPMADWLAQAKGLLAARAALGELMAAPRGQG